jgi:hypothetical protein
VDSENVSSAFANRSAVYFEMGYYEKALENIELAINHNCPMRKLAKLKIREEKCIENLNNKPVKNDYEEHEKVRKVILKQTLPANKKMPCYVADCLELKKDDQYGRYITTNRDLKVGTVVAIEEAFSKNLFPHLYFERCNNCLSRNLLNLIPCEYCTLAMYCSEECKKIGWKKNHQFECDIAHALSLSVMDWPIVGMGSFIDDVTQAGSCDIDQRSFLNPDLIIYGRPIIVFFNLREFPTHQN